MEGNRMQTRLFDGQPVTSLGRRCGYSPSAGQWRALAIAAVLVSCVLAAALVVAMGGGQ